MASQTIASIERQACRWAPAEDSALSALDGFRSLGNLYQSSYTRRSLAITQWKRGKLAEALATLQASVAEAEEVGTWLQKKYGAMLEALIRIHLGEHDKARAILSEVRASLRPADDARSKMLVLEYLGDVDLEQGKAEPALALYREALAQALALVPRGDVVAELRRRIAECHLLMGRPAEAKSEAAAALELCREIQERYDEAATYRVLALACAKLGQPAEAKKHFAAGFATFDEIETPYEWGKLWMAYGDWLADETAPGFGNASHALEAYRTAVEHFERLGAASRLGEAQAKLEAHEQRMRSEHEPYVPSERKARPARRPKLNAERVRRAQWALDTFGMVTRSESILEMLEDVARVAVSDLPVLVLGESGTGKELVAQGVHRLSGRVGEFLAVNASAVPESMLESEFFGHMKGAFTNALADKVGLFEAAHEGTIFLDEIGEMSVDLQAKLLRYLETGELRRVGGTRDLHVNARVVAATNRTRESMQKGSGFRSDLYYRLAHAVYTLPPLRQRGDDVELLLEHYLAGFNRQAHREVTLSEAARARLLDFGWPGNVRQLRAVIQKMVIAAPNDGPLTPRDVPLDATDDTPGSVTEEMDAQLKASIEQALRDANGNKTKAADILNLRRTSLITKMKRLGLMP
ncbi:MAG: sigma 54-interacting transcriptional regulator [Candidatus Eisenbacteria bacterium]|nr:sigma 54-interacting transcriptional regulator [Candidatus Eisenbacteria bacterium]